jgi:beta-glucosidase
MSMLTTPATQQRPAPTAAAGPLQFPKGFRWGAATSAYQVEGATGEDGRGTSIWDKFAKLPGKVHNADSGAVAADHYHRWEQDVSLMAELGLRAYRMSVAWPRIQPDGSGAANQRGLDFYRRLVDRLLEHGIEPWITLYHWDLPQPLEDAGGWPSRALADRFADYAALVYGALHDRVKHWMTMNEPWCSAFLGYAEGVHAPGRQDAPAAVRAAHHLLLGHGRALAAMRAIDPANQLGITLDFYPVTPAADTAADREAARRVDGLRNRLLLDPVLRGSYPQDVLADLAGVTGLEHLRAGDEQIIGGGIDQLGVNYYRRYVVAAAASGVAGDPVPASFPGVDDAVLVPQDRPRTALGWEIDASGLRDVLLWLHRDYPPMSLAVTENGAAGHDYADPEGDVHDPDRVSYLADHVRAAGEAVAQGVDLRGYFVWSLLDNFEWSEGYSKRFGLVYVDYATQRRTPKDSARWYSEVIRRNGLEAADSGRR